MRRLCYRFEKGRVAYLYPDHPLLLAGGGELDIVIKGLEKGYPERQIVDEVMLLIDDSKENVTNCVREVSRSILAVQNSDGFVDKSEEPAGLSMATLNLIGKCNLKCRHCYAGNALNGEIHEFSPDDIRLVIRELDTVVTKAPRLLILSGGEPTLNKRNLMVAIEEGAHRGFNLRVNSNGYSLDDDLVNSLRESRAITQISLDGIDRETHSILRRSPNSFDVGVRAIQRLVDSQCRVRISTTIHADNYWQIPDLIAFTENIGAEQFITTNLVNTGNALTNSLKGVPFATEFDLLFNAVKGSFKRQQLTRSTLLAETINAIRAGVRFSYCGTGTCTCCVNYDGVVYPCINMMKDEFTIGNLLTDNAEKLWQTSEVVGRLRNLNVEQMNDKCPFCDFRHFCGAFCRGETVDAGEPLTAQYVRCSDWKRALVKVFDILAECPDLYCFYDDPIEGVLHRE